MSRKTTFGRIIERLNRLPPFFIYYAAGHNHRNKRRRVPYQPTKPSRPKFKEFAQSANMTERTFARIASSISWDNVKVKHIEPFCRACGVDMLNSHYLYNYIRMTRKTKRPYSHLNEKQLRNFNALAARHLKMLEEKAAIPLVVALQKSGSQSD